MFKAKFFISDKEIVQDSTNQKVCVHPTLEKHCFSGHTKIFDFCSETSVFECVGLRVFILEKILTSAYIRSGLPENLPDGRIVVLLEGENKEKVVEFVEKLKRDIQSEFGSNPHKVKFSELVEDPSIELPNVLRSASAMQMQQFSKGIIFLKPLPDRIERSFNKGWEKMGVRFGELGQRMDKGFDRLENNLPKRIAEELGNSLPQKMALELKKVLREN